MVKELEAIQSGILSVLPELDKKRTLNLISIVDSSFSTFDIRGLSDQYLCRLLGNSTPMSLTAIDFIVSLAEGEQLSKREGWLVAVANAIKHGYVSTNRVKAHGFSERACDSGVKKGFLISLYEHIDLRPKIYILSTLFPVMDAYIVSILPNVKFNFIVKTKFTSESIPTVDSLIELLTRGGSYWNYYNKLLIMFTDRVVEGYDAKPMPSELSQDSFNYKSNIRECLASLLAIKRAWHSLEAQNINETQFSEYFTNNIHHIYDTCR